MMKKGQNGNGNRENGAGTFEARNEVSKSGMSPLSKQRNTAEANSEQENELPIESENRL